MMIVLDNIIIITLVVIAILTLVINTVAIIVMNRKKLPNDKLILSSKISGLVLFLGYITISNSINKYKEIFLIPKIIVVLLLALQLFISVYLIFSFFFEKGCKR